MIKYTKRFDMIKMKLTRCIEQNYKQLMLANSLDKLPPILKEFVLEFAIDIDAFHDKVRTGEFSEQYIKDFLAKKIYLIDPDITKDIGDYASYLGISRSQLVLDMGYNVSHDITNRDIKVINEHVDAFTKKLIQKILLADSIDSLTKEEQKFVLLITSDLDTMKRKIKNNTLKFEDVKGFVFVRMSSLNTEIYRMIKNFAQPSDTYAQRVEKLGYDIEQIKSSTEKQKIIDFIEGYLSDKTTKILSAKSIDELANKEKEFVRLIAYDLENLQTIIKSGQLSMDDFRGLLIKKMCSIEPQIYTKISRYSNGSPIPEILSSLGYPSVDVNFNLIRLKREIDIYLSELKNKLIKSQDFEDLTSAEKKLMLTFAPTLKEAQANLKNKKINNDDFNSAVISKLNGLNKILYSRITRYDSNSTFFETVTQLGYTIEDTRIKPRKERILTLKNRIDKYIDLESKRIISYLDDDTVKLNDVEKQIAQKYLTENWSLKSLIINEMFHLDYELYRDIIEAVISDGKMTFKEKMHFLGYREYEGRQYVLGMQSTKEVSTDTLFKEAFDKYLSDKNLRNEATLELMKTGYDIKDINDEKISKYLIDNIRKYNLPLYKGIVNLASKRKIDMAELIKQYTGHSYSRKKHQRTKEDIKLAILNTIKDSNIRQKAAKWYEDRDLAYSETDIDEHILHNIRIYAPNVYRMVSDSNLFENMNITERFENLGFKRKRSSSKINIYQHFLRLRDSKNGLAGCKDKDGYVDSYRNERQLFSSVSILSSKLSIPSPLIVMLVFREKLKNYYVNTNYLELISNELKEYLYNNDGSLSKIQDKNNFLYQRLVYIAENMYTADTKIPSIYSVAVFLAPEYVDSQTISLAEKDEANHDFLHQISLFMEHVKEIHGNSITRELFVQKYPEQTTDVYAFAHRLGCDMSTIFDMYGMQLIVSKREGGALSKISGIEYPFLDEMINTVDKLMEYKLSENKNLSDEEKTFLYLKICQEVYRKYQPKIENADFDMIKKCKKKLHNN